MVEVDEGVGGPELGSEFLPRHHLTLRIEQQAEDVEALLAHFDFGSELPQLSGAQVERVGSEQGGTCG